MEDEADHLGEIGQGRFPRVVLPVGVGDEAGRRIKGQIRADGAEMPGIERQEVLEPENGEGEKQPDRAEGEKGKGIAFPVLFDGWIDFQEPIKCAFDGLENRVEKRPAVRFQNADQVQADGLGQQQQGAQEENELDSADEVHDQTR